jgi:hypothetical protein
MSLMEKVLCVQKIKRIIYCFFYYYHPIHLQHLSFAALDFSFLFTSIYLGWGKICHAARQKISLLVKYVSILQLHWLHGKTQSYVA